LQISMEEHPHAKAALLPALPAQQPCIIAMLPDMAAMPCIMAGRMPSMPAMQSCMAAMLRFTANMTGFVPGLKRATAKSQPNIAASQFHLSAMIRCAVRRACVIGR
jgi:hypothetical protein